MNRTIVTLILVGLAGFGTAAMADEPSSTDQAASASSNAQMQQQQDQDSTKKLTASQKAFMKDCMSKAKQANNGMSVTDMHKSCKQQLKANVGDSKKPVTPAQ
jgi:Spy/CpxP family protein refolding chaperone